MCIRIRQEGIQEWLSRPVSNDECPVCAGQGVVQWNLGDLETLVTCEWCGGYGEVRVEVVNY